MENKKELQLMEDKVVRKESVKNLKKVDIISMVEQINGSERIVNLFKSCMLMNIKGEFYITPKKFAEYIGANYDAVREYMLKNKEELLEHGLIELSNKDSLISLANDLAVENSEVKFDDFKEHLGINKTYNRQNVLNTNCIYLLLMMLPNNPVAKHFRSIILQLLTVVKEKAPELIEQAEEDVHTVEAKKELENLVKAYETVFPDLDRKNIIELAKGQFKNALVKKQIKMVENGNNKLSKDDIITPQFIATRMNMCKSDVLDLMHKVDLIGPVNNRHIGCDKKYVIVRGYQTDFNMEGYLEFLNRIDGLTYKGVIIKKDKLIESVSYVIKQQDIDDYKISIVDKIEL